MGLVIILVEKWNLKLKRILEERQKNKRQKFRNPVPAPEQRDNNPVVRLYRECF